mmetsp:Transcript_42580/g.112366  ORF Transcript_42580/g.112366 Transcript_42580/m.112366 type:complete len:123 (+) Transcript_42580:962-1330(+)
MSLFVVVEVCFRLSVFFQTRSVSLFDLLLCELNDRRFRFFEGCLSVQAMGRARQQGTPEPEVTQAGGAVPSLTCCSVLRCGRAECVNAIFFCGAVVSVPRIARRGPAPTFTQHLSNLVRFAN